MTAYVFLHGFAARGLMWQPVIDALPKGTRALCPDLLGHGPMPVTARALPFDDEVRRIAGEIRRQGFAGCHLVGYSLGARVALGVLLAEPGLAARATLIGLHPGLTDTAERTARAEEDEELARRIETAGLEAFADEWENKPLFATQSALPEPVLARQRAMRTSHLPDGLATALRSLGLGVMPDRTPRLGEVSASVTLMVGAEDAKFRRIAEDIRPRFSSATLEIVAGCGHNPVLEAPQEVASRIHP